MKEIIEANYKNLERVINWIENTDKKAGIIIAFDTGLIALMSIATPAIYEFVSDNFLFEGLLFSLISLVALTAFCLSMYNAFRVLLPDVTSKVSDRNLFFFKTIVKFTESDFKEKIKKISDDEILETLADQTYINSKIASRKFDHLNRSLIWLFWFLLLDLSIFLLIMIL